MSTLFPHLPRRALFTFRALLVAGLALILGLGALRLLPLAFAAAALVVPILVVLYVVAVDLYEDEPVRVLVLTIGWGAAAGIGFWFLARGVAGAGVASIGAATGGRIIRHGVVLPAVATVLMLAGPLLLLPYRRFNDVLDGATFGVASAAAFAGALTLAEASPLLSHGLRPQVPTLPWLELLAMVGILIPVLQAAAVGAAAGSLWLRFRAPASDRRALGPIGHPAVAVPFALVLVCAAWTSRVLWGPGMALVVIAVLALAAVSWIRRVIHVGLLEEVAERPAGGTIECPDCWGMTELHTFCGNCGVALRALPKAPRAEAPAPF